MNKEEKRYVVEGSVKALANLIPGIGGAIGSILSDALADRKEQRVNIFLKQLKEDLETNKAFVNASFIAKGDFLDIFEETTKKIASQRDETMRIAYKNILLYGIISPNADYDTVEYQIKILDQLDKDHITLLSLFHNPKKFNIPDMSNIIGGSMLTIFKKALPGWEYDYLFDHLRDLENNRLIENITGGMQAMMSRISIETLEGKLTAKGMSFVQYVIR